ncbi:TadE family protein [Massilia yuzhufengensis]|uniref:TadE-like protein n=1 Tax=Massilia yuzhufengensis TaxID=1164594 RepID=A0A1I1EF44_9BURK|nr:TadE family protein [Massilia yuzhufengensis]SFB83553.1 TadE-like protein [Massilia yuzhufengensis]
MNKRTLSLANLPRKREAGVAAIELALLLPVLIVFLLFPIFISKVLWHYTVAQKAAQDAARYLSTVPRSEMMSRDLAAEAGDLAIDIAGREIAELAPDLEIIGPKAFCDAESCGDLIAGRVPATVRVRLAFTMADPTGLIDFGWYGLEITANHTMRYAGN